MEEYDAEQEKKRKKAEEEKKEEENEYMSAEEDADMGEMEKALLEKYKSLGGTETKFEALHEQNAMRSFGDFEIQADSDDDYINYVLAKVFVESNPRGLIEKQQEIIKNLIERIDATRAQKENADKSSQEKYNLLRDKLLQCQLETEKLKKIKAVTMANTWQQKHDLLEYEMSMEMLDKVLEEKGLKGELPYSAQ